MLLILVRWSQYCCQQPAPPPLCISLPLNPSHCSFPILLSVQWNQRLKKKSLHPRSLCCCPHCIGGHMIYYGSRAKWALTITLWRQAHQEFVDKLDAVGPRRASQGWPRLLAFPRLCCSWSHFHLLEASTTARWSADTEAQQTPTKWVQSSFLKYLRNTDFVLLNRWHAIPDLEVFIDWEVSGW